MKHFEFEFVEELPEKNGQGTSQVLFEFASALKDNPGKWAKWPIEYKDSKSHALSNAQSRVKRGRMAAFQPAGAFDAKVRDKELYARYVGETNDASNG